MDFGDIKDNLPLIISVVVLIVLQFFLRRRRAPEKTQQEIAHSLLAEVRLNLRLAEVFTFNWRAKKFIITAWLRNKGKLDFLDQSLQVNLSDAFTMAEDFNQQIAAAKKYKSTSYMASINIDKLKEPLTASQKGLEHWLQSETGTTEPPADTPGVFGDWVGRS